MARQSCEFRNTDVAACRLPPNNKINADHFFLRPNKQAEKKRQVIKALGFQGKFMKSIEHTKTFEMVLPVSILFPLFSPEVGVSYKYLALSATGESFVSEFTNAVFEEFIGEWQTLLSNYLASRA
jgi:hypothetical protein